MITYLNLLPVAYRRQQLVRARLRQWSLAWTIVAATCAALAWNAWSILRDDSLRVESLRRQSIPVENARNDLLNLRRRIAQLRQQETLALSLADEQPVLVLVGCLSRAARVCRGEVAIQELHLERRGGRAADRVLTLDGVALNHQAVARFCEELRNTSTFLQVELKQTGSSNVGGRTTTTYRIECLL